MRKFSASLSLPQCDLYLVSPSFQSTAPNASDISVLTSFLNKKKNKLLLLTTADRKLKQVWHKLNRTNMAASANVSFVSRKMLSLNKMQLQLHFSQHC